MTHRVAVAIVGYRNPEDVVRCLGALERSVWRDFQVIICENGGDQAFADLLEALPAALAGGQSVRAVRAPGNVGFAGGVNICLGESPAADAWWVLNPDTEPQPEALANLVARLETGDCDAVGCTLYRPDGSVQSYGGRWLPWLAATRAIGIGRPVEAAVDPEAVEAAQSYLNGAAMLISRRFLDTVGPMREDYFLYCEEVEWCLRARARGMRLGFAPGARVLHLQGTTTGASGGLATRPRAPVYLGERNRILVTVDRDPWILPIAALGCLAMLVSRYVRAGAWAQLGYGLSGWWAGLRGERGPPPWLS